MNLIHFQRSLYATDYPYEHLAQNAESRGEVVDFYYPEKKFGRSSGRAKGVSGDCGELPLLDHGMADIDAPGRKFVTPLLRNEHSPADSSIPPWGDSPRAAHKNENGTFNNGPGPQGKKWSWRVLLALFTAFGLSVYSVGKALGA